MVHKIVMPVKQVVSVLWTLAYKEVGEHLHLEVKDNRYNNIKTSRCVSLLGDRTALKQQKKVVFFLLSDVLTLGSLY